MIAATALTRSLGAPPGPVVGDDARARLRAQLVPELARSVERLPPGESLEVTLSRLRQALDRPATLALPEAPFSWKPPFVRRSLGLAAVDACLAGRFRTPVEAVAPVAAEAVERWEQSGWRTHHWEPWFAGLPDAARAVVLAEAVTWAASLWTSIRWADLPGPVRTGAADDRWCPPAPRRVCLRGRSELRVPLAPGPGTTGDGDRVATVALVSVAGGSPGPSWADELAFLALVAGLGNPERPVPSRVAGLWPDAGRHHVVEIDEEVLGSAAERVAAAVTTLVDARPVPSV